MNTCKEAYVIKQGREPFDWNAFLNLKRKPAKDSPEYANALDLSMDWVTCACGNQCSRIPREPKSDFFTTRGYPLDQTLASLGGDFATYIRKRNWTRAKTCLRAIERRSAAILRAMDAKKPKKARARK